MPGSLLSMYLPPIPPSYLSLAKAGALQLWPSAVWRPHSVPPANDTTAATTLLCFRVTGFAIAGVDAVRRSTIQRTVPRAIQRLSFSGSLAKGLFSVVLSKESLELENR
jgi:hypothetical protein